MVKKAKSLSAADKKPARKRTVSKKITVKNVPETSRAKAHASFVLSRHPSNPIIIPQGANGWENWQTFNPGVIQLHEGVHFLYRAIGQDGISRLGYAYSKNGYQIDERLPYPAYEHEVRERTVSPLYCASGGSWGGAEDPRIVRVNGEDTLYMTYTACAGYLRVALTSIKLKDFLQHRWNWTAPVLISPPDEIHKNWLIFPEKIHGKYAILHSINPDVRVEYLDSLDFEDGTTIASCHGGGKPRTKCWDKWVRGVGPIPIKTKHGWLVFYHAMDNDWSKYKVGAMLLDLNDPTVVLARAPEPILAPCESYENNGFKAGVVYASGAIVKDGKLLLYYGGADSYVCVAEADFDTFVEALHDQQPVKLTAVRKPAKVRK